MELGGSNGDHSGTDLVLVTGASGFLGGWVLKLCLEAGWRVRATTRSIEKHGKRLEALVPKGKDASKVLDVVELDLMDADDATFDAVVKGCDAVMHTASPFFIVGMTEENVVKPAVEGTRKILSAVARAGIKSVVLTSSTAAIYGWFGCHPPEHVMTEKDWSDEEAMIANKSWYPLGKTRAEKLAWEMSSTFKFNLAVMNPCLIFGPALQPALNTSNGAIAKYLTGDKAEIDNATKCIVDVRDVAAAHVAALSTGNGWGKRHLLVGGCPSWAKILDIARDALPAHIADRIPKTVSKSVGKPALGAPPPFETPFDVSRAERDLGLNFRSTNEMVRASVNTLLEWKHVC